MEDLLGELSKSSLFTVAEKTMKVQLASVEETRQDVELLGTIVDSKYKILQILGTGGMGTVYLARHLMLGKDVALKTFKSSTLTHEERLRFQREAKAIAKLSSPNIIEVFDFGYINDEAPYYTMERLIGQSLREKLDNCKFFPAKEAVSVFIEVCRGLLVAHKKGIIHRDLKPDNIFLQTDTSTATVKIVDFGIAALTASHSETQKLTAIGTVFGSPLYMSPEQSMGQPVSPSSDIYSCGCALFQTLVGKPPFVGTNALSTLLLHQSAPIPNLQSAMKGRDCPQELEELVSTMLAKAPEARYQNVEEVLEILLHIEKTSQLGISSLNEDDIEQPRELNDDGQSSKRIGVIVASAAVVVLSVGTLGACLLAYPYFASHLERASVRPTTTSAKSSAEASEVPQGLPDLSVVSTFQMEAFTKRLASPTPDKRLTVPERTILSANELERIANTSWIETVTAIHCEFDNTDLGKLKNMNLRKINLGHSNLNDQGASQLSQFQTLHEIKAEFTLLTNEGVKELASLKSLGTLRLSGTKVECAGIRYLCKKNPKCKKIYIVACPKISPEEINKLRREFRHVEFITDKNTE